MGGAAALLVGARLALPYAVKSHVNARLAKGVGRYTGEVADVRLALWRGEFALRGLRLRETGEFFELDVPEASVNVEWGPLAARRMVVVSAEVSRPSMRMKLRPAARVVQKVSRGVREKARELKAELGERQDSRPLPALLEEVLPFRVDRLTLRQGTVLVRESGDQAQVEFADLQVSVENLTNAAKWSSGPVANGRAAARVGGSSVSVAFELNPTAREPTFHLTLAIDGLELKNLNGLLRSEWGIDAEKGTFDLYAEADAREGRFKGYVKPFVQGLEVGDDRKKGALKRVKEAVIDAASSLLRNKDTEAVASRTPFAGSFDDPRVGVWAAVLSVLRNAFVKALTPSFEGL